MGGTRLFYREYRTFSFNPSRGGNGRWNVFILWHLMAPWWSSALIQERFKLIVLKQVSSIWFKVKLTFGELHIYEQIILYWEPLFLTPNNHTWRKISNRLSKTATTWNSAWVRQEIRRISEKKSHLKADLLQLPLVVASSLRTWRKVSPLTADIFLSEIFSVA